MTISDTLIEILQNPPDLTCVSLSHDYTYQVDRNVMRPHNALSCERRMQYEYLYPDKGSPSSLPLIVGQLLHHYLEATVEHIYATEVKIDLQPMWPIVGSADIVSEDEVLDIKTTNKMGLLYRIRDGAAPEHIIQTGIYAYALQKPNFTVFYLERDTFKTHWQTFTLAHYVAPIEKELQRLKDLHSYFERAAEILPTWKRTITGEPIYLDPSRSWECKYCPFQQLCIEEKLEQDRKWKLNHDSEPRTFY